MKESEPGASDEQIFEDDEYTVRVNKVGGFIQNFIFLFISDQIFKRKRQKILNA